MTGITLAGFTIRNTPGYAVSLGTGVVYPRLSKLRIIDDGEFVQATLTATGAGVAAGLVEDCSFEYVGAGRNLPVGLDIRGGRNWTVRRNRFLDAAPTDRVTFGPAILAWQGSSGMVVERNVFTNTTLEIVMGLDDRYPDQNVGGAIRNNVIVRRAGTGAQGRGHLAAGLTRHVRGPQHRPAGRDILHRDRLRPSGYGRRLHRQQPRGRPHREPGRRLGHPGDRTSRRPRRAGSWRQRRAISACAPIPVAPRSIRAR